MSGTLVERWADGEGWPPDELFLRIVDLVLDEDIHRLRGDAPSPAKDNGIEPEVP